MTDRGQWKILRYSYAMIATVVVTGALIAGWWFQDRAAELDARSAVERLHMPTLLQTQQVLARIDDLERGLRDSRGTERIAGADGRAIRTSMYAIGRGIEALTILQRDHGDTRFEATIARAHRQYELLKQVVDSGAIAHGLRGRTEALDFTLQQLDRLHFIASDESLRSIATVRRGRMRRLLAGAAILVLVGGALVYQQLRLLRGRLAEHERTSEALRESERRIQQQEKMEALGTLVGGVAHDFNNLLTVILGQTASLLDGKARDPSSSLRQVQHASERAAELTRQLLTFSRPENAAPTVLDLGLLIRDLEPLLRRVVPATITLELESDDQACYACVDRVQVEQMVLNLAINARDAMPDGGMLAIDCRAVTIDTRHKGSLPVPPGSYVRVRVTDTGCGMSLEVRDRAFDPFFTTKERGKGTGLGLSTVHGIVTKHGGVVSLQSRIDEGTRFDIFLPAAELPVVRTGEEATTAPVQPAGGHEGILVVEDEDGVRQLACEGLRRAGYRVMSAANADEAIRLCEEQADAIDLVLTDVVMPGMRGPELIHHVRRLLPATAVVFMSGYADEDQLKGVQESGRPFVAKPFRLRELLTAVRCELDACRADVTGRTARSAASSNAS